jgi:small lipoprotein (TIGR04454 family)
MLRRAVLLAILVGCGGKKDSGPSCEKVVDHMLEVTKQQLMGHDGANFSQQKKGMIKQCEDRNYSGEIRTCLVAAQTISDIAKCRGGKTDVFEKPRRPRPPQPGSATGSAAPSSGSGSAAPAPTPAPAGSAAPK